jgi:DNA polymerase III delta subunit
MAKAKTQSLMDTVRSVRAPAPGGLHVVHQQNISIAVLLEKQWRKQWVQDPGETELVRFSCEGKNHEDLLQVLGDQDLFGGAKAFCVRDCEKLVVKSGTIPSPEEGHYLFLFQGRTPPSWLGAWVKELGSGVIKSKAPETKAFSKWATDLFAVMDFRFSPSQQRKLNHYYQENVGELIQLLTKLDLFKSADGSVSDKDFDTFLQAQPAKHFFTLSNLLLDLKLAETSHFVRTLRNKGESEFAILGFLASFFRRAALVADARPGTKSVPAVPPFLMGKYRGFAAKVGRERVLRSMRQLAGFDVDWKKTGSQPALDMDALLFGLV